MMELALPELHFPGRKRVPSIEAAEAAECGLACIAMVARYHGHDVDLSGLRQRFSVSLLGTTLRALMAMADQLGFSTRALKLDMDSLGKLALPAILHWDLNHFVVLTKVSATHAKIHDPAIGVRNLTLGEVSKHFTGVALELMPSADFKPIQLRNRLRVSQLWSGITGLRSALIQIFALSAALQVTTFAAPFQLQLVVDDAIYHADHNLLLVIALGFGGLVVLQAILQYLRDKVLLITSSLMGYQVVGNLVHHLLRLSTDFFEKRHLGDLLSRVRSSEPIRNAVSHGIISAIIDGSMALFAGVILFFYSGVLAFIVLVTVGLYLVIMLLAYPALRERTRDQIVASASEQTNLMENLRAAVTVKMMGREAEREAVWRNKYAAVVNAGLSVGNVTITTGACQALLTGIQSVLVVYFAGRMIIDGTGFSVGMLIAFFSFRQTFTARVTSLVNQAMQFRLLTVHLDRLSDIVNATPESSDTVQLLPASVCGAISLNAINFRYGTNDPWILRDVMLDVAAGDFVAIVGPSGCGKSTLLKVMLGLHTPDSGEIWLDSQRANHGIWRAWRSHVGMVAQDDRLLSGTIADNIAFFDPDLAMEKIVQAAVSARIHDEIVKMPMQYLSLIGDMGSALSGGQRQRILLARALYRQPKILVLDEGTANLDQETENEIAELIANLSITRIVVAHRPALVARASRVFRFHNQTLVECTTEWRNMAALNQDLNKK